jgi:UDP-N-acetylglucosamine 1-carboxyvinyltransferase
MTFLTIEGSNLRPGSLRVAGYKHALVSVLAAAVNVDAEVQLTNVPHIEDSRVLAQILAEAGARVSLRDGQMHLDARGLARSEVPPALSQRIHGSLYLIPAFLGRLGSVRFEEAGGCQIGDQAQGHRRPVDHMLSVLESFGARFETNGVTLTGSTRGLRACELDIMDYSEQRDVLTGPRVSGATKTAILAAACVRNGTSVIRNPYPKPDVTELLAFLRRCGHSVQQKEGAVHISHGSPAPGTTPTHALISDISEVMTYITCAVFHEVPLTLEGLPVDRVRAGLAEELRLLERMGVRLEWTEDSVSVAHQGGVRGVDIDVTSVGIYSDHQPFFALMLLKADRPCRIREWVWKHRFGYAQELMKLGAKLEPGEDSIVVHPSTLRPAKEPLHAGDLRAAAVLVLAALGVEGETRLTGAHHLDRGYERLLEDLQSLGARMHPSTEARTRVLGTGGR